MTSNRGGEHEAVPAERVLVSDLGDHVGAEVTLLGWLLNRRALGGIGFLLLRDRSGVAQVVFEGSALPLHESSVRVTGKVVAHKKAPGGFEVQGSTLEVISEATQAPPVELAKED